MAVAGAGACSTVAAVSVATWGAGTATAAITAASGDGLRVTACGLRVTCAQVSHAQAVTAHRGAARGRLTPTPPPLDPRPYPPSQNITPHPHPSQNITPQKLGILGDVIGAYYPVQYQSRYQHWLLVVTC